MSELARAKNLAPSRRSIIRTAAWTVPAISIAVAAPAVAATPDSDPARITVEDGTLVKGNVKAGQVNHQLVQWDMPITVTNASLDGLMISFAGSTWSSGAALLGLTVRLFNDDSQSVGTWTIDSLANHGSATFNQGSAVLSGTCTLRVTWTRETGANGEGQALFSLPGVQDPTWVGGQTAVGPKSYDNGKPGTP